MKLRWKVPPLVSAIVGIQMCILAVAQTDRATEIAKERLAKHAALFKHFDIKRPIDDVKPNAEGIIDLTMTTTVLYASHLNR